MDGLGSMRQGFSNGSATLASTFDYSAFGEKIGGSGGSSSPYGWGAQSGYRQDGGNGQGDCGLVLMGARWYDPAIGRFTSRDSDITQSAYVYCGGDPINFTDPSGHDARGDTLAGLGILIAALLVVGFLPEAVVLAAPLGIRIAIAGLFAVTALITAKAAKDYLNQNKTGGKETRAPREKEKRDPREPVAAKGGIPGSAGFGITTSFSADPSKILERMSY